MTEGSRADLSIRPLSEFAHSLANHHEVDEVLDGLAGHVAEALGAAGVGVALADRDRRLRRVTGINELAAGLEVAAERSQEGPCVNAFQSKAVVVVSDLEGVADAWPTWSAEARRQGVRSALGLPLVMREKAIGAVNVYSTETRDWTESEIQVAQVLADMAASYLASASALEHSRRTAAQLREALDSRIIIEQAKGMLASELRVGVDEAFVILRQHARRTNASLHSVSHAVVHLGLRPRRTLSSP